MLEKSCPVCSSSMVLRTARRGRNTGGQFWGCSKYPKCKGLVALEEPKTPMLKELNQFPKASPYSDNKGEPVHWRDSLPRGDFHSEYISIAAVPAFAAHQKALQNPHVRRITSQALLLSKKSPFIEVEQNQKVISSIIQKLLTRGTLPLSTLRVEEAAIGITDAIEHTTKLDDRSVEVGWKWASKPPRGLTRELTKALCYKAKVSDADVSKLTEVILDEVLDGDNEKYFFSKWLTQTLGKNALHWFTPQAELDLILASAGIEQSGQRKIDFLFSHPTAGTIAVELDGEDHEVKIESDNARNNELLQAGIKTFRIPNSELEIGEGPNLSELEQMLQSAIPLCHDNEPTGIPLAINATSAAARFQFVLARALNCGQLDLKSQKFKVGIRSDLIGIDVFQAAADDFADMVVSLSALYSENPTTLTIKCEDITQSNKPTDLKVAAFTTESPLSIGLRILDEDYGFCPAYAPVEFFTDSQKVLTRTSLACSDNEKVEKALLFFLQNLFRKRAFRELQSEGIRNVLMGRDTVTLLPTGAGKSIIYQLAGLLQSGITIVVDPIVSLIEDQILGLARVGIDKAGAAPSGFEKQKEKKKWLRAVERGDFQFVLMSPERLQMADTREALRALAEVTFVNLAVIDEAHCVSEWGHSFRFAYLNLADNLRNYCRMVDGQSPTVLALTGTASRSVLRELLTELKIDKNNSESLIRPLNFDRKELKFHITKVNTGGDSSAILRGILNGLPAKFNAPPSDFYSSKGLSTNSGIVFTPFVNGRSHGLFAIKSAIQSAAKVPVTTFSGSAPKGINKKAWETEKRVNAQSFKNNESPILVATKAFGMGIDKPNVRWTVHMGIPSSMEAFYQEAGRAGRDQNLAYCSLIFSEVDAEATDKALSSQGTLEDLRIAAASFKNNNDDISRALFFHLNAYSGVEEEINEVSKILESIGELDNRRNIDIPFDNTTKPIIERAVLRLMKAGIIDDLLVNFGSGTFSLQIPKFNFERARKKLELYISDAQPARLKTIVLQMDEIENLEITEQPIEMCRLIINFIYDVLERSRRRMLYEAILLGRNCSTDNQIRRYLLDYLQEGLGAEQIAALAEKQEIDFTSWIELFEKVSTPLDAGEIRGVIIRLLETFPDHPGMLASRGISEALVTNPDQALIRDSLLSALESGKDRYSCTNEQLCHFLESILDLADSKSVHLRIPLLNVLQKSEAVEDFNKAKLLEKAGRYSAGWDDISRMCIFAINTDYLINNAIRGASEVINHFTDLQRKIN